MHRRGIGSAHLCLADRAKGGIKSGVCRSIVVIASRSIPILPAASDRHPGGSANGGPFPFGSFPVFSELIADYGAHGCASDGSVRRGAGGGTTGEKRSSRESQWQNERLQGSEESHDFARFRMRIEEKIRAVLSNSEKTHAEKLVRMTSRHK